MFESPYRYEKNTTVTYLGKEYSLIEHIKNLREENHISKVQISRIIKDNDYWYSQLEMKNDNNRRKFIKHTELVDIISVVKFNASSRSDLKRFWDYSNDYIVNVISPEPVDFVTYDKFFQSYRRSEDTQRSIIKNTIDSISKKLELHYQHILDTGGTYSDIEGYIECLLRLKASLIADARFTVEIIGLPLQDFLLSAMKKEKEELINEILNVLSKNADDDYGLSKKELAERIYKIIKNHENKQ